LGRVASSLQGLGRVEEHADPRLVPAPPIAAAATSRMCWGRRIAGHTCSPEHQHHEEGPLHHPRLPRVRRAVATPFGHCGREGDSAGTLGRTRMAAHGLVNHGAWHRHGGLCSLRWTRRHLPGDLATAGTPHPHPGSS